MATNFPTSLDSLTNPTSSDSLASPSHSAQHANVNDAVEALQAKVGVDGSAVTTSHDYILANGMLPKLAVDTDTLFVDDTNDRVGINDSTPSYALDVTGDINSSSQVRVGGTPLPFRIAAGAQYGGAVSTTVTYPSGRFTVNPVNIFINTDSSSVHPRITANSTTSFTYINSVGANQTLVYIAVQMTSSTATG